MHLPDRLRRPIPTLWRRSPGAQGRRRAGLALVAALSLGALWLSVGPTLERAEGSVTLVMPPSGPFGASRSHGAAVSARTIAQVAPPEVVQFGGPIEAVTVARDGRTAFVGVGPRVVVFDACTPDAPVEFGRTVVLPGVVRHILLEGERAYVSVGEAGVIVLDVSDPATPSEIGRFAVNGLATQVLVDGPWLYVVAGTEGFQIFDRSADPLRPRYVSVFNDRAVVTDAAVKGEWAFIVSRNLKLVHLADRSAPNERQAMVDWADAVELHGDVLLVGVSDSPAGAQRQGKLWAFDVRDPERGRPLIGSHQVGPTVKDIVLDGNTAWLLTQRDVQAFDVSDPRALRSLPQKRAPAPATGAMLVLRGPYLLLAAGGAGLDRYDTRTMSRRDMQDTLGDVDAIAMSEGYVYVEDEPPGGEGQGKVHVIDVRDAHRPRVVAALPHGVEARALWVGDGLLVAGEPGDRVGSMLWVWDVSRPAAPTLLGQRFLPEKIWAVTRRGDHVYVANDRSFRVISIAQPRNPRVVGLFQPDAGATDLSLTDHACCVATTGPDTRRDTGHDGLEIVNVLEPTAPRTVGFTSIDGWRNGLVAAALSGRDIAIGGERRTQVFDLGDLGAPREMASLALPEDGEVEDRAGGGGTYVAEGLTIADTRGGVRLLDLGSGSAPIEQGYQDTIHGVGGIASGTDGMIAAAAGEAGLWLMSWAGPLPRPTVPVPPTRMPEVIFAPIVARGPVGEVCR